MILACLGILLLLFGCTNPPMDGCYGADEFVMDSYLIREGVRPDEQLLVEKGNLVAEGDLLQIALFHPTRADLVATVRSIGEHVGYEVREGEILLPDLTPIEVEGLSFEQARLKIQRKYTDEIKDVEIFLTLKERKAQRIDLAGNVAISSMPVSGSTRLFDVLARAKVPTDANLFRSYVVRNGRPLQVDFYRLLKEGDMSQNVVMAGGDKVYIADAADSTVIVTGEVKQTKVLPLTNGFMPLKEALSLAGGVPFTADKRYIQVIRGNSSCPKVYTLHWEHVMRLPTGSVLLMPGDIVYVAATPLAEWNRFVEQVLPSFIGLELASKGIKNVGINID